jgi:multisubunit Na+/H+ antiporter MnhE subunit
MTRARSALVGLLIAAPFYWLLIDTTYTPDLIAGAVAAVIAGATYSAAHLEATGTARLRLSWLPFVLSELAKVPVGVIVVCREILAQSIHPSARRGTLTAEPLEAADDDAQDRGRRALVEAMRSFAPDTVVIGADADHDRLVLHRLGVKR